MSMFDEASFLGTTTNEETSTQMIPVPEGEYNAVIESLSARQGESDKGTFTILDVTWNIDDAAVAKETGRDKNTCRQSLFLDMTADGGLDFSAGKNVQLGRLREALGQNKAGKAWSPSQMEGNVARVLVAHSIDKNDDSIIYANIKRVSAL